MKSKTSFFNKTIFLKNVSLYWPLWGGYTLILLGIQPLLIWTEFYTSMHNYGTNTFSQKMADVISILAPGVTIFIVAIAAVLFGMAVYSYLYNSKNANMIHALPVNKTELFGTNVISGLAFLIVPQILTFIVSVFVCLAYGMTRVEYLAVWLLIAMATAFIAFAFVTVCAMFTGLLLALPVYVLIVNFFSYWVYYLLWSIVSIWGYGVDTLNSRIEDMVITFCPLLCLTRNVSTDAVYEKGICTGMEVHGIEYLLVYFAVAVVLYAIAYITYQKRHIETAGELISVKWLKPVFRYGIGISGGIFGSLLVRQFMWELGIEYTLPLFILVMLFLGAISYFGADMFVRKTFRVFKKKNWMGCGAFSVCLLATFFVLYGAADMYEKYVPDMKDVDYATINMGYEIEMEDEASQETIALHEEILTCTKHQQKYERMVYYGDGDYEYVQINYSLKNGDFIRRTYLLPYEDEELAGVIAKIEVMEKQPENYLAYDLGKNYDKVTEFGTGWLEARFTDGMTAENSEYEDYAYDSKAMTPEIVEKLWAAVIADAKEGTLIKYNVYSNWADKEKQDEAAYIYKETANIHLEYRDPDFDYGGRINYAEDFYEYTDVGYEEEIYVEDYESWSGAYISFGDDCENIINTLIECGMINSADDIYWGEEAEETEETEETEEMEFIP